MYNQGWIGWFCQKALEIKNDTLKEPFTISNNGKQVRDVLHGEDVANLYFSVKDVKETCEQTFNVGGGIRNSLSPYWSCLICSKVKLYMKMSYNQLPWRESDQKVFVADMEKTLKILNWSPEVSKERGLELMMSWLSNA